MYSRSRKNCGSGLVETAAGLIFLIPVLFILIDVAALVIAQTQNDSLAKKCARAAAEMPYDSTKAKQLTAAQAAMSLYGKSTLCAPVALTTNDIVYPDAGVNSPPQQVQVTTTVNCLLPIPVPFGGPAFQTFKAFSTEPIVGQLPN